MAVFQDESYVPQWKRAFSGVNPDANAAEPIRADAEESDDSLDRLQRSLIWFGALLIAISIYENFQHNF